MLLVCRVANCVLVISIMYLVYVPSHEDGADKGRSGNPNDYLRQASTTLFLFFDVH